MTGIGSVSDDWEAGVCRANGIDIRYQRSGTERPTVIALHGLTGSGDCLKPLARSLIKDFDVILPDARGHGSSSMSEADYSYDQLAADVIGLIAGLKLRAPVLLGHSMGGMTAAVAARELGSAIGALVLVDPTFISPEWQREVFESGVADQHRQALTSSRETLLATARTEHPSRPDEMSEYLVDAVLRTDLRAFEILTPPNPEFRALIAGIAAPTLLILGERGIVSPETARELQALNPQVTFDQIANVGHGLPYDDPAAVGAIASAFLDRLKLVA